MLFHYLPTNKIIVNDVVLEFGLKREMVREKLSLKYKADDQIIPLRDPSKPIIQRRDIYQIQSQVQDFFFLDYDAKDLFAELEIHECEGIKINDFLFGFDDEVEYIASQLGEYSPVQTPRTGEYFFPKIKALILDKWQMGSEGTSLGYFYCAHDVSHLIA